MRLQVLSPVTILLNPLLLTRVPSPGLRVYIRLRTVVVLRFIHFIDALSTDCSLFPPFFAINCMRYSLCWTGRTVFKKVRSFREPEDCPLRSPILSHTTPVHTFICFLSLFLFVIILSLSSNCFLLPLFFIHPCFFLLSVFHPLYFFLLCGSFISCY